MGKLEDKPIIASVRVGGGIIAGVVDNNRSLENQLDHEGENNEYKTEVKNVKRSREFFVHSFGNFNNFKKQNNISFLKSRYIKGILLIFLMIGSFNIMIDSNINVIPYPFSKDVNNQTKSNTFLQPGGAFYNTQTLINGSTINYQANAKNPISFAIWNTSVENLPHKPLRHIITQQSSFELGVNEVENYFLFKGDSLNLDLQYDSQLIGFTILNKNQWTHGDYQNANYINNLTIASGYAFGSFIAPKTGEYYLNWFNIQTSIPTNQPNYLVSTKIQFRYSVPDFTKAAFKVENVSTIPTNTFKTQNQGNFTEFIYSNQKDSNSLITNPVNYNLSSHEIFSSTQEWNMHVSYMNVFSFLFVALIIILFINEIKLKYQKFLNYLDKEERKESFHQENHLLNDSTSGGECPNCGLTIYGSDSFCANCGFRIEKQLDE